MAYKIVFAVSSRQEALDGMDYYTKISESLGERFKSELLQVFEKISENPQHYSFVDEKGGFRDVALQSFPYVVVFEFTDDIVSVVAVLNTYRRPRKF